VKGQCVQRKGFAAAVIAAVVATASNAPSAAGRQRPQQKTGGESERAAFAQYCVTCHNDRLKTAGFVIDPNGAADVSTNIEVWEKALRKLQLGVMPPAGARRPDEATYAAMTSYLVEQLDAAALAHPDPGRPVLHRLNRSEYANAIRDLLGLKVDVSALLPPDDAAYGFDNVADALKSSPALLQSYLVAARKISALAIGDVRIGVGSDTYSVRQDLSQDQHLDGLPLGTYGGLQATHTFPVDAEYDFQIRLYRTNLNAIRGVEDLHHVELTLDGKRVLLAQFGGAEDLVPLQKNPTDTSDAIEAHRFKIRLFVKAGVHQVAAAFPEETPSIFATSRLQPFLRDFDNPYAAEGAPHVQSIAIQGPYGTQDSGAAPSPRIFSCRPSGRADEAACARRILSGIADRAYRRPPSTVEVDGLMHFFDEARSTADGTFARGVEFALRRILASPSFVFRVEREPDGVAAGTPFRVGDFELASRLSFFLWSSIPDEDLLKAAASGTLNRPEVLAKQVRRMMADPRSAALVENFASQWLQLRNLRGIVPNPDTFPDFDDNLRQAFRREAELFFESVVHEDRNVLDLITADYTFMNERLARHYGVPGVFGSSFRRVQLTDEARKGLLGKGAILLVTSHATTTSPVLRGKWVLENILGAPPPAPPPDVPALKENEPGAIPRTMREQMEQHRVNTACAGCHKTMDPIGFALENFDVVGAWRTSTEAGVPLDTADVMADGTRVNGVIGLRRALMQRPEVFVQTLTEKLMVYALGRGLTPADLPTVRRIVRSARSEGYRFSALVSGIVGSQAFQMRIKLGTGQGATRLAARQ
jgi:mono/diheme cytochrome c family protein